MKVMPATTRPNWTHDMQWCVVCGGSAEHGDTSREAATRLGDDSLGDGKDYSVVGGCEIGWRH